MLELKTQDVDFFTRDRLKYLYSIFLGGGVIQNLFGIWGQKYVLFLFHGMSILSKRMAKMHCISLIKWFLINS